MRSEVLGLVIAAAVAAAPAAGWSQPKDRDGCKDHPLFTRMPGFIIATCAENDFDAFAFVVAPGKKNPLEGHYWQVKYFYKAEPGAKPSNLQIVRNFENAIKRVGGVVVHDQIGRGGNARSSATLKLAKDGKELWADVSAYGSTGEYLLNIIQKDAMEQDIEANAEAFANDLRTTGHAAVYGITFDTDSARIKPESAKALGEVAKLLKAEAGLNVHVVGHTDDRGTAEHNLKLSQARAQAVLQALVKEHGIAAGRLTSHGCGPYAPVATNDTEEGRAKNRRVELVKH